MSDREDAAMKSVKESTLDPPPHRVVLHATRAELLHRNHPVLSERHLGDGRVKNYVTVAYFLTHAEGRPGAGPVRPRYARRVASSTRRRTPKPVPPFGA